MAMADDVLVARNHPESVPTNGKYLRKTIHASPPPWKLNSDRTTTNYSNAEGDVFRPFLAKEGPVG